MKIYKYFLIKEITFFFLFIFNSLCLLSSGISQPVEEGWRYHQNFKLKIKYEIEDREIEKELDLTTEHHSMAHSLRSICLSSERKSCLLRFIPIIYEENEIKLGETIRLTEEPLHLFDHDKKKFHFSYPELVFLSGFGEQKNKNIVPYKSTYDFQFGGESKPSAFSTFPAVLLKTENSSLNFPFALNIIQRNYINLLYLDHSLNFRYPDPNDLMPTSLFAQGNYQHLHKVIQETKEKIREKPNLVKNLAKKVKKLLDYGDMDSVSKLLDKDPSITTLKTTNSNAKMNDYACAEQGALCFLNDDRIRCSVGIEDQKVIGIIINAHCSHTPCCSCTTSFTREVEDGGIFKSIFNGKKIFFICSTQNHYPREPKGMIRYDDTNFVGNINPDAELETEERRLTENMKQSLDFEISQQPDHINKPYPIILMEYNDDNNEFEFNEFQYKLSVNEYLKKHLNQENEEEASQSSEEDMSSLDLDNSLFN